MADMSGRISALKSMLAKRKAAVGAKAAFGRMSEKREQAGQQQAYSAKRDQAAMSAQRDRLAAQQAYSKKMSK